MRGSGVIGQRKKYRKDQAQPPADGTMGGKDQAHPPTDGTMLGLDMGSCSGFEKDLFNKQSAEECSDQQLPLPAGRRIHDDQDGGLSFNPGHPDVVDKSYVSKVRIGIESIIDYDGLTALLQNAHINTESDRLEMTRDDWMIFVNSKPVARTIFNKLMR